GEGIPGGAVTAGSAEEIEREISGLFFFSSRRRHTSCYRDWSSDVCSSDLSFGEDGEPAVNELSAALSDSDPEARGAAAGALSRRSEERRVGKAGRSRWWPQIRTTYTGTLERRERRHRSCATSRRRDVALYN